MREYLPLLLLIAFVIANAVGMLVLSALVSPQRPTVPKSEPYESGMPPLGGTRERFSIRFYLIAMLFIIFDIETVFMIPWGVFYRQLSCSVPLVTITNACPAGKLTFFGLGEMLVFMLILVVGLAYVWKKGALQWD